MIAKGLYRLFVVFGMCLWLGAMAGPAAASVMLTDQNAGVVFDPLSPAGLTSWSVDGVEHLNRQWFWYRTGSSGPEHSIDTLTLNTTLATDTNFDGDVDTLYLKYLGADLSVELTIFLRGGLSGSHRSDMTENLRLTNLSSNVLDLHFFQYTDFDLNGNGSDDTVQILGGNTARQTDRSAYVAETVGAFTADHYRADLASTLLAALEDASPTTLLDAAEPVTGDVAWAFQWDKKINPGQSFLITKSKNFMPEPATLAFLGLGSLGLLRAWRRRR